MDDYESSGAEQSLIHAFIARDHRRRWLTLRRTPRGRQKLRAQLAHLQHLDPRFAQLIASNQQTKYQIESLLKRRGAPEFCYVLSEDPQLDGRQMGLSEALDHIVGAGMGSLVSCVPGHLGYYEGEEPNERYLLIRP